MRQPWLLCLLFACGDDLQPPVADIPTRCSMQYDVTPDFVHLVMHSWCNGTAHVAYEIVDGDRILSVASAHVSCDLDESTNVYVVLTTPATPTARAVIMDEMLGTTVECSRAPAR